MNKYIKMVTITNNVPVKDNVFAWGMSRVNARLFTALSCNISLNICTNNYYHYKYNEIVDEIRGKTILLPRFPRIVKFMNRYFNRSINQDTLLINELQKLVKKIKQTNSNWIFCPCGVNPYDLGRGVELSKACGLPLAVYLVDDFVSGAVLSGNKDHFDVANRDIPIWLKYAKQIFVISEGLQQRIKSMYNLESVLLPLPYDSFFNATNLENKKKRDQIMFVGNLSHFYVDGIKEIAAVIKSINEEHNCDLKLRFTIPNTVEIKKVIGDYEFIISECFNDINAMYYEISQSLLCYVPYSFKEEYKEMVSSSFPSKILDMLAAGRFVVVYGPEYSTSISYFKQNNLPFVLYNNDINELKKTILYQIQNDFNYSKEYNETLKRNHSAQKIAEKILNTLDQ